MLGSFAIMNFIYRTLWLMYSSTERYINKMFLCCGWFSSLLCNIPQGDYTILSLSCLVGFGVGFRFLAVETNKASVTFTYPGVEFSLDLQLSSHTIARTQFI